MGAWVALWLLAAGQVQGSPGTAEDSPDALTVGDDAAPPAGAEGGPCYGNASCDQGLTCVEGECRTSAPAGGLGGLCLEDDRCDGLMQCVTGRCAAPADGAEGGPCYGNDTCNDGLVCRVGTCVLQAETWEDSGAEHAGPGGLAAEIVDEPLPDDVAEGPGVESDVRWGAGGALGARAVGLTVGGLGCGLLGLGMVSGCLGTQLDPVLQGDLAIFGVAAVGAGACLALVGGLSQAGGLLALGWAALEALDGGLSWQPWAALGDVVVTLIAGVGGVGILLLSLGVGVVAAYEVSLANPSLPGAQRQQLMSLAGVGAVAGRAGRATAVGGSACAATGGGLDLALLFGTPDPGEADGAARADLGPQPAAPGARSKRARRAGGGRRDVPSGAPGRLAMAF